MEDVSQNIVLVNVSKAVRAHFGVARVTCSISQLFVHMSVFRVCVNFVVFEVWVGVWILCPVCVGMLWRVCPGICVLILFEFLLKKYFVRILSLVFVCVWCVRVWCLCLVCVCGCVEFVIGVCVCVLVPWMCTVAVCFSKSAVVPSESENLGSFS